MSIIEVPPSTKPCPFCGESMQCVRFSATYQAHVHCLKCSARGPGFLTDQPFEAVRGGYIEATARAWNGRPVTGLAYPSEMTPAMREVLSTMVFVSGPIAHHLRDNLGHDIPRKCEAEQAYVLHWMMTIALEHGENWRQVSAAILWPDKAEPAAFEVASRI